MSGGAAQPGVNVENLQVRQDQVLLTIRRASMSLLGVSLFSLLTLGIPDSQLLGAKLDITIPFANVEVRFVTFLIVSPLILTANWVYLQIYVTELHHPDFAKLQPRQPVLNTLPGPIPRLFAEIVNTVLLPAVLFVFAFKALFHSNAYLWFAAATLVTGLTFGLRFCRVYRGAPTPLVLRVTALVLVCGGFLIWARTPSHLADLARYVPVRLIEAELSRTDFRNLRLTHGLLMGGNFLESHFANVSLVRANLSSANLAGAVFGGTTDAFYIGKLDDVISNSVSLIGANLTEAILIKAEFKAADLSFANLSGADLRESILTGAIFDGATLTDADLRCAQVSGVSLEGAHLVGADLRGADLTDVILREADLRDANLQNAILVNADLARADLNGADFTGANLAGANLNGANVLNANILGADLTRANLTSNQAGLLGLNRHRQANQSFDPSQQEQTCNEVQKEVQRVWDALLPNKE